MSRRDDVSQLYKYPNYLARFESVLFWFDIIAGVIAVFGNAQVSALAIMVQIVVAVLYFISNAADDGYFWYRAEKARRKNNIENGLGTRLSEFETEEYYNNQVNPSIEKYALNSLESNYFSKNIAGKMILESCIKSVFAIIVLIIACRFVQDSELLLIVAQTALSSYVLLDMVMLIFYKVRLDNLFDEGYAIMISQRIKGKEKNASLLAYSVEYEAIKAHYKIRLDEKLFKNENKRLSAEWERILEHREQ